MVELLTGIKKSRIMARGKGNRSPHKGIFADARVGNVYSVRSAQEGHQLQRLGYYYGFKLRAIFIDNDPKKLGVEIIGKK